MDLPPDAVPADQYKAPTPALPPDAISADDYSQFERNKTYAKPGPYQTQLNPGEEQKFRNWLKANPSLPPFDPTDRSSDYDMRGFYKALKRGDERAKGGIDPYDKKLHLPDVWKTPYHRTFSRESIYATEDAPHWEGDRYLVNKDGKVIWDDKDKSHQRPGLYTPNEMQNAASGAILDFGGKGQDTAREILRPILGEAGAEEGANAIANLYKAMPYLGMLAGLKGPKAEAVPEVAGVPYEPPAPSIQPPREPIAPPVAPAPAYAGENPPPVQPTYPPDRPTTAVPVARVETPVAPAAPETPYAPRPETPIAPARPETSFAADAVAAQPPPEPLIPAQIAPIAASAAPEAPPIASAAPEPPESPQTPVIGPPEAPPAPVGRSAIGRTPATPPGPAIETIGDIPIEQGDRDFAALLKQGAEKDADLAKFISKPRKAEPIIMQARRLYLDSNGEISPIDLGKRLGIPKRTAQAMVKGLDSLAAADEKKLTLTAPAETAETTPAGEETAVEPSQAELEAAGQQSMFGPAPTPKPVASEIVAAPRALPPEAIPENKYTPERFAGTEETIGTPDPNSRVVRRDQIFTSPEHFQYKVGGDAETGGGLSLMGADKFDYNAAKDLMLWYDEKGEIGPPKRYYVVNGHQRLALATRDNAEYVPAVVLDSGSSLKDSIAQGVSKENARARGAVLNFQQGRGTSIDAATFMRDGGLTEEQLQSHYRQLDLGEKNVKEAIELSKLDNWLWAEVANHRLKPELGAVIGRELPNDPPAQFSIFQRIDRLKAQGKSITPERLDDEINAQKIAGAGKFESETKDMFGEREMRKSLVEETADLWGKARKQYAEGKLHGTLAKKQAELERGDTKIDVATAKQIASEYGRRAKEFDTFRKINGSETVKVTREYAARLAAEPKMKSKIYDAYTKAIVPAMEADKINFRLQPGEMKIEEPQAELPVK